MCVALLLVGVEGVATLANNMTYYPYYGIPSTIAVNMIMAAASGGMLAVAIAVWAQVRGSGEEERASEAVPSPDSVSQ